MSNKNQKDISPEEIAEKARQDALSDGRKDFLTVDPKVHGQDWCVISMIRPEDLAKKREMFFMDRFLKEVVNNQVTASVADLCRRMNGQFFKQMDERISKLNDSVNENAQEIASEMTAIRKELEFQEEEMVQQSLHSHQEELDDLVAKYDEFKLMGESTIGEEFDAQHGKQASVMGIKFSGAFPFQEAAADRAEFLGKNVEPGVDHYVAQSFFWCPFDPDPNGVTDQRHLNEELNELMKRKMESQEQAKAEFESRKKDMVEKAQENNREELRKRLREKYGKRKAKKTL